MVAIDDDRALVPEPLDVRARHYEARARRRTAPAQS
jgi:hypothetical protein